MRSTLTASGLLNEFPAFQTDLTREIRKLLLKEKTLGMHGMRPRVLKVLDAVVTALIALVMGLLFAWWTGVVVFIAGLALISRTKRKGPMRLYNGRASDRRESGEWLEEWHDDMRRRQIGPYEWRD